MKNNSVITSSKKSIFYYALLLKKCRKFQECQQEFIKCLKITDNKNMTQILFEYGYFMCHCRKQYQIGISYLDSAQRFNKDNEKKEYYSKVYDYYNKKWRQIQLSQAEGIPFDDNDDGFNQNIIINKNCQKRRDKSYYKHKEGHRIRNEAVLQNKKMNYFDEGEQEGKIWMNYTENTVTVSHSDEVFFLFVFVLFYKYNTIN